MCSCIYNSHFILLILHKNLKTLEEILNIDLKEYFTWFQANKLPLNLKKSNVMTLAG